MCNTCERQKLKNTITSNALKLHYSNDVSERLIAASIAIKALNELKKVMHVTYSNAQTTTDLFKAIEMFVRSEKDAKTIFKTLEAAINNKVKEIKNDNN